MDVMLKPNGKHLGGRQGDQARLMFLESEYNLYPLPRELQTLAFSSQFMMIVDQAAWGTSKHGDTK